MNFNNILLTSTSRHNRNVKLLNWQILHYPNHIRLLCTSSEILSYTTIGYYINTFLSIKQFLKQKYVHCLSSAYQFHSLNFNPHPSSVILMVLTEIESVF